MLLNKLRSLEILWLTVLIRFDSVWWFARMMTLLLFEGIKHDCMRIDTNAPPKSKHFSHCARCTAVQHYIVHLDTLGVSESFECRMKSDRLYYIL